MAAERHQSGGDAPSVPAQTPTIMGFTLGPFETNCYVVRVQGSKDCWIVDASFEPDEMIEAVKQVGLRPVALVLTHAHCDHIAGAFNVVAAFPELPVWIHKAEREWLSDPMLNLSAMMGAPVTGPEPARLLEDGDMLDLAGESWSVLHTPGHSPGGITLHHAPSHSALVGDALFAGSIGRTDFPGSDHQTLVRSIREKLYKLPDDTRIYPGHGPESTIGREKRSNPFVRA